jgi:hypothetical protein
MIPDLMVVKRNNEIYSAKINTDRGQIKADSATNNGISII